MVGATLKLLARRRCSGGVGVAEAVRPMLADSAVPKEMLPTTPAE